MSLYEEIEFEYQKRKEETEKRAVDILYGSENKSDLNPISKRDLEHLVLEISEDLNNVHPVQTESRYVGPDLEDPIKTQIPDSIIENETERFETETSDESEVLKNNFKFQNRKGFTSDARRRYVEIAQKAGLVTMNEKGLIQKRDGTIFVGLFRRD